MGKAACACVDVDVGVCGCRGFPCIEPAFAWLINPTLRSPAQRRIAELESTSSSQTMMDLQQKTTECTRRGPFDLTPIGVNSISPAHLHVRPMGRTCRWAGEIKKNTHPKFFPALFREQARSCGGRTCRSGPASRSAHAHTRTHAPHPCQLVAAQHTQQHTQHTAHAAHGSHAATRSARSTCSRAQ